MKEWALEELNGELKGQRELKVPYDSKLIYLVVTNALEDEAVRTREQA